MPAYWLEYGWTAETGHVEQNGSGPHGPISVFLADDNLIVREGVRALINARKDLNVVGVAADYGELVSGAERTRPQVLVTDIRMPPTFTREGIDAAREVRKRYPGTGVVVLSQYEDPEYVVSLLAEGSAGYGYLLKDRVAEGSQLVDAIRAVATGGTALDPSIVEALVAPVVTDSGLGSAEEELLGMIAEGKTIKAIDRKSTRLNSSHISTSYAVFCLKKKKRNGVSAGVVEHLLARYGTLTVNLLAMIAAAPGLATPLTGAPAYLCVEEASRPLAGGAW